MRVCAAILIALGAVLASAARAGEPQLTPYEAKYAVKWGSMELGVAEFSFKRTGPDCYHYETVTDPIGLVRMFYGQPREISEFCIRDGLARPAWMRFQNPKKSRDDFELRFDWAAGVVRGPDSQTRAVASGAVDRLTLHQSLRLWVMRTLQSGVAEDAPPPAIDVAMVDDDRIRSYHFELGGVQTIQIGKREFKTHLVRRTDDPRKTVLFWIAPELGYQIVRFEQSRENKSAVSMEWIPPNP